MPGVLNAARVTTEQCWDHVIVQVACNGQFAAVERGIAQAVDAVFGNDLERNEIAPRTGHDHAGLGNPRH